LYPGPVLKTHKNLLPIRITINNRGESNSSVIWGWGWRIFLLLVLLGAAAYDRGWSVGWMWVYLLVLGLALLIFLDEMREDGEQEDDDSDGY